MKTEILITTPRTIQMDLHTVIIPDLPIYKLAKKSGYVKVGDEIRDNFTNFIHKPGERVLGIYPYESTRSIYHCRIESPADISHMFVTHKSKTLKGRFATVEELICFEPYLKHSRNCITIMGEDVSADGYKYNICRHTSGFPEGVTLEKQWVQSKGILVAFEKA